MKNQTHMVGTTDAEAEALRATAALIEAGGDPFGDDGEDEPTDAAAADAGEETDDAGAAAGDQPNGEEAAAAEATGDEKDGEGHEEEGGEDDPLTAEALAAVVADEEESEPTAAPAPRYNAGDPTEFKAKRDEQNAVKAKALKDLMDGVIEPEEYSRIESEVADKLEAIAVQRTLHEANVQSEQQANAAALEQIITAAKKAGEIDYMADQRAAKQFDAAMRVLAEDGETRTYGELVAAAHKVVLAVRGINKPAPAAAPAAAPAQPRENGKGPVTLRNVPAAETANSGGGWKEQLNALSGQAYEEAYGKLSQAQKNELLND